MIGIAATNMQADDYDECTIVSYDSGTGKVKCSKKLKGFHYGAFTSSEADYGVDMRAEVWLMDRNIRIQASLEEIGHVL
jgi:hypothetical protein